MWESKNICLLERKAKISGGCRQGRERKISEVQLIHSDHFLPGTITQLIINNGILNMLVTNNKYLGFNHSTDIYVTITFISSA